MITDELKARPKAELKTLAQDTQKELTRLRVELKVGKLKDTSLVRKRRRELAGILTLIKEKKE